MNTLSQAQTTSSHIKLLLSKPYFPFLAILVAVILLAPCLDEGLFLDDWFQRLKITGNMPISYHDNYSFFGLFNFIQGDPH